MDTSLQSRNHGINFKNASTFRKNRETKNQKETDGCYNLWFSDKSRV